MLAVEATHGSVVRSPAERLRVRAREEGIRPDTSSALSGHRDAFATHLSCAPAAARLDAPVPRTAVARLPAACSVLLAFSSKVERAGTQAPLILLALLTCSRLWSESVSMRGARCSSLLARFSSSRLREEHDLFLFSHACKD